MDAAASRVAALQKENHALADTLRAQDKQRSADEARISELEGQTLKVTIRAACATAMYTDAYRFVPPQGSHAELKDKQSDYEELLEDE